MTARSLFPRRRSRAAPLWLAAGLAGLLALPAPALGAERPALAGAATEIADTLPDPPSMEESADLLVEEALALDDTDPEKAERLRAAGRLYEHAGEFRLARTTTLHAGIAAYHAGEHAKAAHIFLDAADVALNRGLRYGAESAADRAGWVLRNGDLTEAERASVLRRVKYLDGVEVEASEEQVSAGG